MFDLYIEADIFLTLMSTKVNLSSQQIVFMQLYILLMILEGVYPLLG